MSDTTIVMSKVSEVEEVCRFLHSLLGVRSSASPRRVDKPLFLYGAGDLGLMARDFFQSVGVPIAGVIDRRASERSKSPEWTGIPVFSPEQVEAHVKTEALLSVCISTLPFLPIKHELARDGWSDIVPFYDVAEAYRARHPLSNGWFGEPLTRDSVAALTRVIKGWSDSISRSHHLQFLAWRYARQEWIFPEQPVTTHDRYFPAFVRGALRSNETFLDIGAYDGRISEKFLGLVDPASSRAIAVEGDPINLLTLRQKFDRLEGQGLSVRVIPAVLAGDSRETLFSSGLGYASRLSSLGSQVVSTSTVDSLRLEPTFMKLHVEGSELEVLNGSLATIKRSRPILAVTSYHNELGSWELPLWFMSNCRDYDFFMRLHGWVGTAAVIYAIPRERIED